MSSLYFLGGGGSSERVPEVLMDLHEPHGRHCSYSVSFLVECGMYSLT